MGACHTLSCPRPDEFGAHDYGPGPRGRGGWRWLGRCPQWIWLSWLGGGWGGGGRGPDLWGWTGVRYAVAVATSAALPESLPAESTCHFSSFFFLPSLAHLFTSHCVLASLLVNKTNLFSQPPVSVLFHEPSPCDSIVVCLSTLSVHVPPVVKESFQRLSSMLPFFLCASYFTIESHLLSGCLQFPNGKQKLWIDLLWLHHSLRAYLCDCFWLGLFHLFMLASPSSIHPWAWLDLLFLSSGWVQRTTGTSYRAWSRTSPLNPPHHPLYQDRDAPGKVRTQCLMCHISRQRWKKTDTNRDLWLLNMIHKSDGNSQL